MNVNISILLRIPQKMVVFVLQMYITSGRLFAKKYLIPLVVRHLVQDGQETHYTSGRTK